MVAARTALDAFDADAEERDALAQRLAVCEAERSALLTALRRVLATIPAEFASPETQAVRMMARALVVEMER